MYYFFDSYNTASNSSIENAAVRRLRTFSELNQPAKLLLMEYDPKWYGYAQKTGLDTDQVENVFDFFQEIPPAPAQRLLFEDFHQFEQYDVHQPNRFTYEYSRGAQRIGQLKLDSDNRIDTVTYFNGRGEVDQIDTYDTRGFLSNQEIFDHQRLAHRQYFTPTGKVALEEFIENDATTGLLITKTGEMVNGIPDLWWRKLEATTHRSDVFVSDRREYDWFATHMRRQSIARIYNARPQFEKEFSVIVDQRRGREFDNPNVRTVNEDGRTSGYQLLTDWRNVINLIGAR